MKQKDLVAKTIDLLKRKRLLAVVCDLNDERLNEVLTKCTERLNTSTIAAIDVSNIEDWIGHAQLAKILNNQPTLKNVVVFYSRIMEGLRAQSAPNLKVYSER